MAWCTPVCAVGFDSSGSRVWENWSSPIISRSDDISWFDDYHPEQLEELFPRFMSRWCNKEWNDTLKKVIYWYVIANNVNDDVGIILAHTALERLSYQCYKAKIGLTEDQSKDLKNLFDLLEIPDFIIDDIPELRNLLPNFRNFFEKINKGIKEKKFKDLSKNKRNKQTTTPLVLSEIRNYLVHPNHKYDSVDFSQAIHDTNKLGLWYLELSLLNLFKYPGKYYNRLEFGYVGKVSEITRKK